MKPAFAGLLAALLGAQLVVARLEVGRLRLANREVITNSIATQTLIATVYVDAKGVPYTTIFGYPAKPSNAFSVSWNSTWTKASLSVTTATVPPSACHAASVSRSASTHNGSAVQLASPSATEAASTSTTIDVLPSLTLTASSVLSKFSTTPAPSTQLATLSNTINLVDVTNASTSLMSTMRTYYQSSTSDRSTNSGMKSMSADQLSAAQSTKTNMAASGSEASSEFMPSLTVRVAILPSAIPMTLDSQQSDTSDPQSEFAATNAKYASAAAGVQKANNYGISWTPFNGGEGDTSCKSQLQANVELQKIAAQQFTVVRVYGASCNQVQLAVTAAHLSGLKLMLGVYDLHNVVNDLQSLIQQVNAAGGSWALIDTVSIGNEDVENGVASPSQVISAIATARKLLATTPYQGEIIHVDTVGAIVQHPELCGDKAGDYVAANAHPFFSAGTSAAQAGQFVAQQNDLLRQCSLRNSKKRSNHRVVVTETGWPTGGIANGQAVPGRAQQFAAIASIKKHVPDDVFLYSAFNNKWLPNSAGTFGAEHYWGILDD